MDQGFHFEGEDREPGEADEGIALDCRFEALELTEHQKNMLQLPEQRIKQMPHPEFVQQRSARRLKTKRGGKRGGKVKKHTS